MHHSGLKHQIQFNYGNPGAATVVTTVTIIAIVVATTAGDHALMQSGPDAYDSNVVRQ